MKTWNTESNNFFLFYCDGDCSTCTSDDCEDRCEQHGKCKDCRAYEECEIRCELAKDGCNKWVCKGFECDDRTVEIEEEREGLEDTEEDGSEEEIDGDDSEDEGWEESDEE